MGAPLLTRFLAMLIVVVAGGCAGQRSVDRSSVPIDHSPLSDDIAMAALAQIGAAYRYGGASPEGFDCSGLVQYVHALNGIRAPRTSIEQFARARHVPARQARAGDLVFFRIRGRVSHVGIYLGADEFLHAPSSGNPVRIDRLDGGWYARRFAGFGRFF